LDFKEYINNLNIIYFLLNNMKKENDKKCAKPTIDPDVYEKR
jgi:hypothetical protein